MKTYMKKDEQANRLYVQIPFQMASEFSKSLSVDAYMLKPGVILICTSDAKSEIFGFSNPIQSIVSEQERAVINKISKIRFFERTEENTHKILDKEELVVLSAMLSKKYITLFKNQKYPQGVYNISNRIFQACKNFRVFSQPKSSFVSSASTFVAVKPIVTNVKPSANSSFSSATSLSNASSSNAPFSNPSSSPSAFSSNASSSTTSSSNASSSSSEPNPVEQLKKLGYTVLSNETQAKLEMQNIKEQIKDDEVCGVRGFDRRYYVAKKSFLKKYEEPIFALLDESVSNTFKIASKLNMDPDAITAFFVILSDEGLVFEKRRGEWAKA